ncbi:MAG: DUF167 domain-containing protein, partial [Elusimicrobia bacterium]|nr:DUF167 domain-containing protein [Elusimicrobiota bacterium]
MGLFKLKVHAGSRREELKRKGPDAFEAHVKAPAERGLANASALRLLAAELGCEPGRLRIIKG